MMQELLRLISAPSRIKGLASLNFINARLLWSSSRMSPQELKLRIFTLDCFCMKSRALLQINILTLEMSRGVGTKLFSISGGRILKDYLLKETLEITDDFLATYTNQSGYDLLGMAKDHLKTTAQVKSALAACKLKSWMTLSLLELIYGILVPKADANFK
ncbi:hypothetical protein LXL04_000900 [Taraxacum kok-saghyz]